MVVFLLALTFGGNEFRWDSAAVIVCFVLGILLLVGFCLWNFLLSKNQVVPTEIVVIPQMMASVIFGSAAFGYFVTFMLYGAIYFQVIKDTSALGSGLHLLPMIIAVVISSISGGMFIQKTRRIKIVALTSGLLGPIGAGLICLLDVDSTFSQQVGLLILAGIAIGLQMQPTMMSVQLVAPKAPGSTILATTFVNFFRSMISAIAADLAGTVYNTSLTNYYDKAIKEQTNQNILN